MLRLIPHHALLVASAVLCACVPELDTTPEAAPASTAGEAIYRELCQRIAAAENPTDFSGSISRGTCAKGDAPAPGTGRRLRALHAERTRLITALDAAIPASMSADAKELLVRMLPLYDEGKVQAAMSGAATLAEAVQTDTAALAVLERLGHREGYRPLKLSLGLLQPLLAYPRLNALSQQLAGEVTSGAARPAFQGLVRATRAHLLETAATPASTTDGADSTLATLRTLALSTHPSLGDGKPRFVVHRDARGMAHPASLGASLVAPFVDADHDGLADTNGGGRYIDAAGRPLEIKSPFELHAEGTDVARDRHGRLLTPGGALVYDYVDLTPTVLGGLLRQTSRINRAAPAAVLDTARIAPALLGAPRARELNDATGRWTLDAFDTSHAAALELVHALSVTTNSGALTDALLVTERLLAEDEPRLAALATAATRALELVDTAPYATRSLREKNTLVDDLLSLGVEVLSQPGLAEDLLAALRDPASASLGEHFARFATYRDRFTEDPSDLNAPALGNFATPVDRAAPDARGNQSILQRFMHLIAATNGARLCNKQGAYLDLGFVSYPLIGTYDECELFEVENLAVFYSESIAGRAALELKDPVVTALPGSETIMELYSEIDGFTLHPTPQALNRFVFAPRNSFLQNLIDPPRTIDGLLLEVEHPKELFVFEKNDFYAAIRPLVTAFANHGRVDLFVDTMTVLHRHYSSTETDTTQSASRTAPRYAAQTGLVRFEGIVAELLGEHDLLGRTTSLVTALAAKSVGGRTGEEAVLELARDLLLPQRNEGLRLRDGSATLRAGDGVTLIDDPTPARLWIHALRELDRQLALRPATQTAVMRGVRTLTRQALATTTSASTHHFAETELAPLGQALVTWAREQIETRGTVMARRQWTSTWTARARDTLDEPTLQAAVALADRLLENPATRAEADALAAYVINTQSPNQAFECALTVAGELLELADSFDELRPLAKPLASALDADAGLIDAALELLSATAVLDVGATLPQLLAHLVATPTSTSEPGIEVITDVLYEVNRLDPGAKTAMSASDLEAVFETLVDFSRDDERGLERLFELIENR